MIIDGKHSCCVCLFQRRQGSHKEDSLRVCGGQSQGGSDLRGGQVQPTFPGKHQSGAHTMGPERVSLLQKSFCEDHVVILGSGVLSLAHCVFFSLPRAFVSLQRRREPRRGGAPGEPGPERGGEGLQYQSQVHSMLHAPHAK